MDNKPDIIHKSVCPLCGSTQMNSYLSCKDYLASKETFDIYKCQSCSFAFTQDFPVEAEIGKYYDAPEYVSHSDTNKGIINYLYHKVRKISLKSKARLVSHFSGLKKGILLDIGSGTGYFLNKMKEHKWLVTGVEKSDGARLYAKQKFDIDTQVSDYLYEIAPESKDVITMWHVLEHLEKLDDVMSKIVNIVKDEGTILIALPNKDSLDASHYKEYWAAYDVPRHLWHFSPSDFEQLTNKYKLELIEMKPMYFDVFYISMLSEKNKGTLLGSVIGLCKGFIFYLRSIGKVEKCSSVVYILKKKSKNNIR